MRNVYRFVLVLCVVFVGPAALLEAQDAPFRKLFVLPSAIASEDYGVQDVSYTVIPATDFRPFDSATGYAVTGSGGVNRTGGGTANFAHAINLPAGAILVDMTTYLSDTNATSDVRTDLFLSWRATDTGASPGFGYYSSATAQSSGMPGDTAIVSPWNATLPARFDVLFNGTLDDVAWMVVVALNTTDNTNSFSAVRLKWKRQVSPAPGTARYTDVPTTHPFFQYVEALAAAGITSGCSASR